MHFLLVLEPVHTLAVVATKRRHFMFHFFFWETSFFQSFSGLMTPTFICLILFIHIIDFPDRSYFFFLSLFLRKHIFLHRISTL